MTTAAFLKDGQEYIGCASLIRGRGWYVWILKNNEWFDTIGICKTVPEGWDAVRERLGIHDQMHGDH